MDEIDHFKRELQRHFTDGLAIVVGSGLSCAEGMSGMGALADHLDDVLKDRLGAREQDEWAKISHVVKDEGLEAALMAHEPTDLLDEAIARSIVEKLGPEEQAVLNKVVSGKHELRFSKLVKALPKTDKGLPVDTMFDGDVFGRADPDEARRNHLRAASIVRGTIRTRMREHIRVFKPHGSLDWYGGDDGPLRFGGALDLERLIVSPGRGKLRKGYDRPFADHRETLNRCLSSAARLLVVGYGFNDDHLETHLSELIRRGAPTLILTRSLSENAMRLAMAHPAVTAIDYASEDDCRVIRKGQETMIAVPGIWDLGIFVDEVLRP